MIMIMFPRERNYPPSSTRESGSDISGHRFLPMYWPNSSAHSTHRTINLLQQRITRSRPSIHAHCTTASPSWPSKPHLKPTTPQTRNSNSSNNSSSEDKVLEALHKDHLLFPPSRVSATCGSRTSNLTSNQRHHLHPPPHNQIGYSASITTAHQTARAPRR